MMNGAFPDVVVTEKDLITIKWSEMHIYQLREGKVVEHWAEIALMELLQQVGVLPQLG